MKKPLLWIILILSMGLVFGFYRIFRTIFAQNKRTEKVFSFLRNPERHQDWVSPALTRCGDAPFILPSTGMIGFIWGDSFRPGHQHQGIDIFSGANVGETPVYAVYDGYLTRLPEWKSTVIIRIPVDPIRPGRQIWTYYTHMADPSGRSLISDMFPPGTTEKYVSAGSLLGLQGNYSGTPDNPTGVHLHFSIVRDDGQGMFLNELDKRNTIDPSPYFNLPLNITENPDQVPICDQTDTN